VFPAVHAPISRSRGSTDLLPAEAFLIGRGCNAPKSEAICLVFQ
jgi:hypothetical protein